MTELAQSADAMRPPRPDAVEVLLTLSEGQYAEMSRNLEVIRGRCELPRSTSNTDVIRAALAVAAGRE